jgi:hypothetical protein
MSDVIEHARSYVGFRSRANRVNGFGAGVRQDGKPWNGSFLETVFHETGVSIGPSLVSTTAALAHFNRTNRLFQKPRVGDIVFYAWSTDDDGMGQPHVGLVTEVRDFNRDSKFKAIEGMTNSGLPKGPQEHDGIYERTRYRTDVLAFARPKYERRATAPEPSPETPTVRPSQFVPGKTSKPTVLLQLALNGVLGNQEFNRGTFDAQTASAVRAYQRRIGILPPTETVDLLTLNSLARDTEYRYFKA